MRKFREKNGNYKKNQHFSKIQNSCKQMQNFSNKVAKIDQKRLNFENKKLLFKEGFICEPN